MFSEFQDPTPTAPGQRRTDRPSADGDGRRPSLAPPVSVSSPAEVAGAIERLLVRCRRQRGVFALVRIRVEDIVQHDVDLDDGLLEEVCADIARRLRARVRSTDLFWRETEREACIVLPHGDAAVAAKVADRLLRTASGIYGLGARRLQVRLAVGGAAFPDRGSDAADLLEAARPNRCE